MLPTCQDSINHSVTERLKGITQKSREQCWCVSLLLKDLSLRSTESFADSYANQKDFSHANKLLQCYWFYDQVQSWERLTGGARATVQEDVEELLGEVQVSLWSGVFREASCALSPHPSYPTVMLLLLVLLVLLSDG